MRAAALLCYGLLLLTVVRVDHGQDLGGQIREIPLFVQIGDAWVCVDRDPAQVGRQDCWPRLPLASKDTRKADE